MRIVSTRSVRNAPTVEMKALTVTVTDFHEVYRAQYPV